MKLPLAMLWRFERSSEKQFGDFLIVAYRWGFWSFRNQTFWWPGDGISPKWFRKFDISFSPNWSHQFGWTKIWLPNWFNQWNEPKNSLVSWLDFPETFANREHEKVRPRFGRLNFVGFQFERFNGFLEENAFGFRMQFATIWPHLHLGTCDRKVAANHKNFDLKMRIFKDSNFNLLSNFNWNFGLILNRKSHVVIGSKF